MYGWPYRHPPNTQFRLNARSPQALGLLGWWPGLGSRGANFLRDYSGNGNHLPFGATTQSPTWAADGQRGAAPSFDGGDLMQIAGLPVILQPVRITISLWFRPGTGWAGSGQYAYLIDTNNDSGSAGYTIQTGDNGIYFTLGGVQQDWLVAQSLSVGTLYHLALTYDGAAIVAYLDGRQIGTTADSGNITYSGGSLTVGFNAFGSWRGLIDDLRIYNRALPANEVRQLYDPQTRWQLYEPVIRQWPVGIASAGGGGVELTVADALHAHTAESPALTQHHVLVVADSLHAHVVESPSLTQHYALTVADALHTHSAEAPALTQHYVLAVADALHAHAVDGVALTQHNVLVTVDALHAHSVDAPALTQHNILALADALHAHTAENVTLSLAGQLTVQDALHAHNVDNVALTQHHVLVVQDATHGHSVEVVALTTQLIVQGALHSHSADTLILGVALIVQDATHAHTADAPALVQHHLLTVADSLHAHSADNVLFGSGIAYILRALVEIRLQARADVEMRFVARKEVDL